MKQTQTDLRQSFHDWLVRQGLSEKTKTGRAGTVYEYVRYIDKVCDIVQSKRDDDSWKWLAQHIYPILGFYILCRKDPVVINFKNKARLEGFLTEFFNCWPSCSENSQKYLVMQTPLSEKDDINSYRMIQEFVWDDLEINKSEITLYLNIPKTVANNERKALQKFYQFLEENKYDPVSQKFLSHSKEKIRIKKKLITHYSLISVNLKRLNFWDCSDNVIYAFITEGGYYSRAPKLYPEKENETMTKEEVRDLLQISDWSFRQLHNSGELFHQNDGSYLVKNVDAYINSCFKPSSTKKKAPKAKELKYWWTAKQIHDNFGISTQYVSKMKNTVARLELKTGKCLYYPYEFQTHSKTKKRIRDKKS